MCTSVLIAGSTFVDKCFVPTVVPLSAHCYWIRLSITGQSTCISTHIAIILFADTVTASDTRPIQRDVMILLTFSACWHHCRNMLHNTTQNNCATRWKVAGWIPDGVLGIFHWLNPSRPGLDSASNRNDTKDISCGRVVKAAGTEGCQHLPSSRADTLEILAASIFLEP